MIEPVMVISNLVLTQQICSEETNGAHVHYREPVLLMCSPTWETLIPSGMFFPHPATIPSNTCSST